MSKRFFPQQHGERKKAKLNITISDHNFPLSQNDTPSKEAKGDTWGDDNDDEILLLASQACEDAYNISSIPDYSMCMQPVRTSTQIYDPGPSTSKPFVFKKPNIPQNVTLNLTDKCSRISSPLPGMSSKVLPKSNDPIDITDDLIFNDKVYKGQDSDYVYRQLLKLQEENAKLKSENGKLLDKCVTKEGEASILRTQLKTCQTAVDNARLDRVKAQEKAQMEWTDKLAAANNQMHDLRNQLDFKNLEIISIKEKCRMLESHKVKLTQVTVSNHDISASHRNNSVIQDSTLVPARRSKMNSSCVQTDKAHFIRLNMSYRSGLSKLSQILPLVLEPTTEQLTLIECNDKLQNHTDLSQNKCRIFSTFHRIPCTPAPKEASKPNISLTSLHEDLTSVAMQTEGYRERFRNVVASVKDALGAVQRQLETVSARVTTAFLKDMDERYIETTNTLVEVRERRLYAGSCLYKDEQAVLARRLVAILACALQTLTFVEELYNIESCDTEFSPKIIDLVCNICRLLESTSCAILYSGLLLSILQLLSQLNTETTRLAEVLRYVIASRPMPFVCCQLVELMRRQSVDESYVGQFCPGSAMGNLKVDYDQGVLLFKKGACLLQVLYKQAEWLCACAAPAAAPLVAHLLAIRHNTPTLLEHRCECQLVLLQVIVYALSICSVMLRDARTDHNKELVGVCRAGVQVLYGCAVRDGECGPQLAHSEGHLAQFCENMRLWERDETYVNMLSELSGCFQSSPDDVTSSYHKDAWLRSFEIFSMTD